ncbi:RTA1-domain-containing protein [Atractiella rhizophila]|nr:RTA1-domain-containing protein [Atractiella rhizophila]
MSSTGTPQPTSLPDDLNDSLYNYNVNGVLPIVAAVVFAVALAIHLWQALRSKSFNYMWPFIGGLILEVVGYIFRRISRDDDEKLGYFIIQQLFVVIAPALLAASLYMSYGRLTLFVEERFSPLRPRWVTRTFVTADVFSFLIQGAGGSLYAGDNISASKANTAKAIITVGFIIQIVAFSCFLVISLIFYRRAKAGIPDSHAIRLVPVLWLTSIPILVRTIFRLAEFASSNDNGEGYLLDHEVFLWVLETIPILISVFYLGWFHPSRYIPNDKALREKHIEDPLTMQQV